ncbi:hypothetical protein Vafri_4081 [Volvox africanus]|uniref:Uncharacterized protein n=1 Tax=Volvox africanus TaxID=51714 RepID=A0A8J4AVL3_9CHLO|nr:hypothetical protein Vafri_4081 [Volvox africanus]
MRPSEGGQGSPEQQTVLQQAVAQQAALEQAQQQAVMDAVLKGASLVGLSLPDPMDLASADVAAQAIALETVAGVAHSANSLTAATTTLVSAEAAMDPRAALGPAVESATETDLAAGASHMDPVVDPVVDPPLAATVPDDLRVKDIPMESVSSPLAAAQSLKSIAEYEACPLATDAAMGSGMVIPVAQLPCAPMDMDTDRTPMAAATSPGIAAPEPRPLL